MIQIKQLKLPVGHSQEQLEQKIASVLKVPAQDILSYEILRQSIDARKKPALFYSYQVEAAVRNEKKLLQGIGRRRIPEQVEKSDRIRYVFPEHMSYTGGRIVVVGAGPGGLFCAYLLAMAGRKPLLLERGSCVEQRSADVEAFWESGILKPGSNVQFGEGGAGTFSDGKLNTLVKDKDGRSRAVLETFVKCGADPDILYKAKPHIGTDVLRGVVKAMREEIIRLGGEVRFTSQVTDLRFDEGGCIRTVVVNGAEEISCDKVVLAIGHSARDTFSMLYEKGLDMEAKAFAVGFRVEHTQEMIDQAQYGGSRAGDLGAAPYKVTAQTTSGRGVYSFCMCPGGYVVNASSQAGELAVNGMSYRARDSRNANSAIIVAVTPADYGSDHPLAGVVFQRKLEQKAFALAGGKIPLQRYGAFLEKLQTGQTADCRGAQEAAVEPCCRGQYAWADLTGILPAECNQAFVEGMTQFGRQIPGFDAPDTVLSAVESRTSSPVRIVRDSGLQAKGFCGLYPCGEGAGYAGGIMSAAMDGMRVAEQIIAQTAESCFPA